MLPDGSKRAVSRNSESSLRFSKQVNFRQRFPRKSMLNADQEENAATKSTASFTDNFYTFDSRQEFAKKLIKHYIRITSFKLTGPDYNDGENAINTINEHSSGILKEQEELHKIKNVFTYDNPFHFIKDYHRKISNRMSQRQKKTLSTGTRITETVTSTKAHHLRPFDLFLFIAVLIITSRLLALAYFHHIYDLNFEADKPQIRNGLNKTEKCALKEDIYFEDLERHRRLEKISQWMEFVGDSAASSAGAVTLFYGIVGTCLLLYYLAPIVFLEPSKVRLDLVSFLLEPKLERLRMDHELSIVIRDIVCSALNCATESRLLNENFIKHNELQLHTTIGHRIQQQRSGWSSLRMPRTHGSEEIKSYVRMLLDSHLRTLVRPIILTSTWYNFQSSLSVFTLISHQLLANTTSFVVQWALVASHLFDLTKQRLELLECRKWHPETVVIKDARTNLLHAISELTSEDLKAYLNFDGSDWNLMKLAFFVESKSFLSFKVVLDIVSTMIITSVGSTWVTMYYWFYFSIHIDKIAWINQIRGQVDQCVSLMSKHIVYSIGSSNNDDDSENKSLAFRQNKRKQEQTNQQLMLIEAITVAYLNFELFRRQQANYQKLANFTLTQASVHGSLALVLTYIVGSSLNKGQNGMMLFLATYMVIFVNIFLIGGALITSRVDKLMKCTMKIIARGSRTSVKSSYALQLWRRQLLNEKDTKRLFAPSIIGMNISFKTVMSFNFYLVFVYLVVLKVGK